MKSVAEGVADRPSCAFGTALIGGGLPGASHEGKARPEVGMGEVLIVAELALYGEIVRQCAAIATGEKVLNGRCFIP